MTKVVQTSWLRVVVPTPLQAISAFVIAFVWMLVIEWSRLIQHFGGGHILEPTASQQLNLRVAHILGLSLVGQAAIILFWAVVGLAAYLIIWWLNNLFIGARNKVIIHTSYTNKGSKGFDTVGFIVKIVGIIFAVGSVALLPYMLNGWLSLWNELLAGPFEWHSVILVAISVCGFAAELYLSFLFFQITLDRFRR